MFVNNVFFIQRVLTFIILKIKIAFFNVFCSYGQRFFYLYELRYRDGLVVFSLYLCSAVRCVKCIACSQCVVTKRAVQSSALFNTQLDEHEIEAAIVCWACVQLPIGRLINVAKAVWVRRIETALSLTEMTAISRISPSLSLSVCLCLCLSLSVFLSVSLSLSH